MAWPSLEGLVHFLKYGDGVFNPPLTCCVTWASCVASLGLSVFISSTWIEVSKNNTCFVACVRKEGGEGYDLTDC